MDLCGEGKRDMLEVKFYDSVDDSLLKFAVIISQSNGKWVFCKHKERDTYEVPGGHREAGENIVETAKRTDAKVAGPIPLPTKRRLYCVLRSPHVDKKSREHFEMRIHKRIIDIYDPTQQTTEELSRMDLPAGVDIEVKL